MASLYTLSNPVFVSYAFYGTVAIVKMCGMAFLTGVFRIGGGSFSNPEDAKAFGVKQVKLDDERVERVRRNHLNDLENIPAFLALGVLYVAINPTPSVALWHFRIFVFSRIMHTVSYQLSLQPFRGIGFIVGMITMMSMAGQIISSTIL